ncbi:HlyD family efflux transporter periplasmic adaptor subunit [Pontiella sulfatireligans]|uniref:Macrolide export protein MacA n=1 Tax=Pontiella sulfatireligans TaxID=2750658 RepID=A0A6C2UIP4_9BACT|nr:HlyD family efflux transporter periplasmic adaptor subunit [Pontiella sulfatireligans]VGO20085.1 Macrolide export protein MacA [Pontiella sulfatireligans]
MKKMMKSLWQRRSGKVAVGLVVLAAIALAVKPNKDDSRIDLDTAHLCRVQRGDLVVSILQSGELKAKISRDILNEAYRDAKITEIVEDGASVTNGQLLFELESSALMERYLDQQSDVAEAEAGLKQAQEQLEIAKLKNATDLETAKLKVELAKLDLKKYEEVEFNQLLDKAKSEIYLAEQELKKARSDLEGTQELFDKGYSNKNDLESDELGVERKEIEVRNKTKDLEILEKYTSVKRRKELENSVSNAVSALERLAKTIDSDVTGKEASIESKKTRLEIEKNQLVTREEQFANTKVYADFEGQVFYPQDRRSAKIEKGATVNVRQRILSFPDLSAWELKVGIPEAMIDKVSMGQEAVAVLDAVPGMVLKGCVEKISAVPDSQDWFNSGVKTYTIMVNVSSTMNTQLKPGMSATVEIVTDQLRDVLHVPIQAVVSSKGKHYVYVVKRGRKALREVGIGKYNTQLIEVVDGLEVGEEMLLYAEVEMDADSKLKKSPLKEENKTEEQQEQG